MPDLHRALKTDVLDRQLSDGFTVILTRLQYGKDNILHAVHAYPSGYTTSGMQTTDLLAYLGFRRSACSLERGECYSRAVTMPFNLPAFAAVLPRSYDALRGADNYLTGCGILLAHPEGIGYFWGKPSGESRRRDRHANGDGHAGESHERHKQAKDAYFQFALTSIRSGGGFGWTTHYRPKHEPLSPEMRSAFSFLGLGTFAECPEFDFETCNWRFTPYVSNNWDGNASIVFTQFDAHPEHFSAGLEALLRANLEVTPFGLGFLPRPMPTQQSQPADSVGASPTGRGVSMSTGPTHQYDVAISFAGPQRPLAEHLAQAVREAGFRVFYDNFYPEQLWGKNLVEFFDNVYRKQSRYCVMFISGEYRDRLWTTHERQSAQARALTEKGNDYILPIMVEDVEVPAMLATVGHLSLQQHPIEAIAAMLIKRLHSTDA